MNLHFDLKFLGYNLFIAQKNVSLDENFLLSGGIKLLLP